MRNNKKGQQLLKDQGQHIRILMVESVHIELLIWII